MIENLGKIDRINYEDLVRRIAVFNNMGREEPREATEQEIFTRLEVFRVFILGMVDKFPLLRDENSGRGLYYPDLFLSPDSLKKLFSESTSLSYDVQRRVQKIVEFLIHNGNNSLPLPVRLRNFLFVDSSTDNLLQAQLMKSSYHLTMETSLESNSHEVMIALFCLNSLRKYIPTFPYYYGRFVCSPQLKVSNQVVWCRGNNPAQGQTFYTVREEIAPFSPAHLTKLPLRKVVTIFAQILNALAISQFHCRFTHNNLLVENISLSSTSTILIPILSQSSDIYMQTSEVVHISNLSSGGFAVADDFYFFSKNISFNSYNDFYDILTLIVSWRDLLPVTSPSSDQITVYSFLEYLYFKILEKYPLIFANRVAFSELRKGSIPRPISTEVKLSLFLLEDLQKSYPALFSNGPLTRRTPVEISNSSIEEGSGLAYCLAKKSPLSAPAKKKLDQDYDYAQVFRKRDLPAMEKIQEQIITLCPLVERSDFYSFTGQEFRDTLPSFYPFYYPLLQQLLLNGEFLSRFLAILLPAEMIVKDYFSAQSNLTENIRANIAAKRKWFDDNQHDWRVVIGICQRFHNQPNYESKIEEGRKILVRKDPTLLPDKYRREVEEIYQLLLDN